MRRLTFLINRINQGVTLKKPSISVKRKRIYLPFLDFLIKERFILAYSKTKFIIIIYFNYTETGRSAVHFIAVNKEFPYVNVNKRVFFKNINQTLIFLTPMGYCTQLQLLKNKQTGQLVCSVI